MKTDTLVMAVKEYFKNWFDFFICFFYILLLDKFFGLLYFEQVQDMESNQMCKSVCTVFINYHSETRWYYVYSCEFINLVVVLESRCMSASELVFAIFIMIDLLYINFISNLILFPIVKRNSEVYYSVYRYFLCEMLFVYICIFIIIFIRFICPITMISQFWLLIDDKFKWQLDTTALMD